MVNLIRMRDKALPVKGAAPTETPRQLLDRHSGAFMPGILTRAGWMIAGGCAAARDLEPWGIEPDTDRPMFAIVRYRSRRDMRNVVSEPEFGEIHPFKFAAIEATRAFPVAPVMLTLGPKLVVGMLVLVLARAAQLVSGFFARRS